ncbi:cytochrome b/b6 domain-containing protein [Jiella sp. MQZ9-1]|uniref:Cytochrome b/b6 domain-containing protein n=1 Tax=Jiella flava TaxID=2816857 RepID=A0A939FWY3_9HYPH|nr:cytochrome b/b6 domain-containing protein [Jiella flava]MBO0663015.1 cytochrome b/b6 domain-containing protein [Jiella flava]MCD2471434.1 cytochrome b/b6 domain-containing protein [Jiella flava]
MTTIAGVDTPTDEVSQKRGRLIYRQKLATRLTHWIWAISLFFLLLSGLQIFMARPDLYIGKQSGFGFDNAILRIDARKVGNEIQGVTTIFGTSVDTTGWLGLVPEDGSMTAKTFPGWLTVPSYRDLATGRVVHFFFAWVLVTTLTAWLIASIVNGHIRELIPTVSDLKGLPRDIVDHLRLRFHHDGRYNGLQKLSYVGVLFVALPVMILTGLTMSPGMDALFPVLLDIFGGRQTARTIHFAVMLALVLFFVVHILMVVLAGPLNELRAIVTGWYRTSSAKRS